MNAALQAIYAQIANVAIAIVLVGAVLVLNAVLDGPTETDAAAVVALDRNDAIADARSARKEQP